MRPTLYTARWVVPVAHAPLRAAGLLVDASGRIAGVAPAHTFDLAGDVARVDFGEAIILPGLINVHAHPELSVFRGLLEDLPFHEWIPTLMRCKRGAQLTFADYAIAARWTCVEALRAGITTVGATEDSGAAVEAMTSAGMRGVVYLEVFGPAPEQAEDALRSLREKVAHHAQSATERVRIGVSPHAPYTVSDALFALVASYARAEHLPVATHAAESEAEAALVGAGTGPFAAALRTRGIASPARGPSTIDLLERTGIMGCAPLLIHAVRVSQSDLRAIAASGATIAHCPIANARLGHGIAPMVEAAAAGITIGIGTDSVASNNRIDMLEEARIAQALQRARLESASAFAADQLLRMVTIDSARILGMDDRIGSLEVGKDADFCAIAVDTAHSVPVSDPLATLFHAARGCDVVVTAVAGRLLYEQNRVATLNEVELRGQVAAIGKRLRAAKESE
jgi:5-methylthioadenosine/S-adenosylhomocysteine deaminase